MPDRAFPQRADRFADQSFGSSCRLPTPGTRRCTPADFAARRAAAAGRLTAVGAHYVIDSAADLMPVIHSIEGRLARGERP